MIFLLMITLVAVTAMRGTALELNLANNTANQEHAFEAAESARVALSRTIPQHHACSFRWPAQSQSSASCSTCGVGRDEVGVEYAWEPRLQLLAPAHTLERPVDGENNEDSASLIDRVELRFANAGVARVKVGVLPASIPAGSGAAMNAGYRQADGAADGASKYFELVASGWLSNARAQVAAHYRLQLRDANPDACASATAYQY